MSNERVEREAGYADGVQRILGCAVGSLATLKGRQAAMRQALTRLDQTILMLQAIEDQKELDFVLASNEDNQEST